MSIAEREEDILKIWKEENLFQNIIKRNSNQKFIFYDGPPFATGLPHYGHIVASTIKDIIPRYQQMMGYDVPRRFGWDTHGLPIEFEIEKKLGIKTKQDVLKFGIDNYNEECRKIVMTYSQEWRKTIERLGRWVDMDNDYKTMDLSFMNKVWWVFSQLYQKDLVYEGVKVMPYSVGCNTPLSNFEAKSNYQKVNDPSLTLKFKTIVEDKTYFLVWTTTPWTLVSNLALGVNPNLVYAKYKKGDEYYWILKDFAEKFGFIKEHFIDEKFGRQLAGMHYQPLYQDFYGIYPNAYQIYADEYVSNESGTGIVHLAPAFGEDDYRVCFNKNIIGKKLSPPCPFNENGYFNKTWLEGHYFKDADKIVIKDLKERDMVWDVKYESHDYPFCWRSNTPLMYRSVPCIFINVEKIKDKIIKNNQKINWIPHHIKDGRFGKWLEEIKDWCVSRNRYWGTPIPLWKSQKGDVLCLSSVKELEELTGKPVSDLHRHFIDNLEIVKDGVVYRRIEEVFDCWFESGSMPYAVDNGFPADFIAEGKDQTRGWFYTLLVLSSALNDEPAFKNVIVNGLVLASDGNKMSKSKKNYPDPTEVINKYGADALRLYLISNLIVRGEDMKFNEKGVKDINKSVQIFTYNTLNFLEQMIPLYEQKFGDFEFIEMNWIDNPFDLMILNYTQKFVKEIHEEMSKYELYHILDKIKLYIDKLSRVYLNMNKSRLKSDNEREALFSLNTLHYCLKIFVLMLAPFTPMMSDIIWRRLEKGRSVHYEYLPTDVWTIDENYNNIIEKLEEFVEYRQLLRSKIGSSKKPIKKQVLILREGKEVFNQMKEILEEECNIMELEIRDDYEEKIEVGYEFDKVLMGKRFKKDAKKMMEEGFNQSDYERDGYVEILGMRVEEIVKVEKPKDEKYYYSKNGMLIETDMCWDEELENIYLRKKMARFMMNLRKVGGLVPTDEGSIYFRNFGSKTFLEENLERISKMIKMEILEENLENVLVKEKYEEDEMNYEISLTY